MNFHNPQLYSYLLLFFLVIRFGVPLIRKKIELNQTTRLYGQIRLKSKRWQVFAKSERGRNIYYREEGSGSETTLILAGFHGDEPASFRLVLRLADLLEAEPDLISKPVVLIPVVNPDGLLEYRRTNANSVDINRNFPGANWSASASEAKFSPGSKPASEPETRAVLSLIEQYKPARIISIHGYLNMNNYDGPARELAESMAAVNSYPVTPEVGYSTPGSFGGYAGRKLNIPVVTLELPRLNDEVLWQQNAGALIAAINFNPQN